MLGPLSQQASDTTEIRFHLGELLYWLKQDTDAEAQWRQVEQDSPDSIYGRIAAHSDGADLGPRERVAQATRLAPT